LSSYLEEILPLEQTVKRLTACGLDPSLAKRKAALFQRIAEAMVKKNISPKAPVRGFFVPGRIEVLGKHTDYAGGRTMVMAVEKGFCLLAVPRDDANVHIMGDGGQETAEFVIKPDLVPTLGHWSNYPMTVARRLARNFSGSLRGADIVFISDLPVASGMSSSSALVVASYLALAAVNELDARPEYVRNIHGTEDLAGYLGTVENGQNFGSLTGNKGVGTFGGSEDHTAILCCQPGKLSQYSYCPVRFETHIDVPEGTVFAVASSGVAAEKTGPAMAQYNRASELVRLATEIWNEVTGRNDAHLAAALASSAEATERIRQVLRSATGRAYSPKELRKRFEQFLAESEQIIPAASEALAANDLEAFGRQVDRSQELAETLLGNQVPETIFLARTARKLGAIAASAFGAGFGGSVWAMVPTDQAESFLAAWAHQYAQAYPRHAGVSEFFLTIASVGAFEI